MSGRLNHNSRNPHSKVGLGSELTATRRPSRSRNAKSGSMRDQEQLTFNFEDSSPEASRQNTAGGESGRIRTVSGNYWSGSTNANNTTNAWNVNFNNGNVNNNNKTNTNYVRAVRGGKCRLSLSLNSNQRDIFSFENIYSAYIRCRKRKRNTANALKFEMNLEENLLDLHEQLVGKSYWPGRSILFVVTKPKLREIFAADFRDRVVHHILVRELEKIWEPRFIHDSYACRRGKGIHGAARRAQKFIRRVSSNGTRRAYYIKLDIKNFFNTLNKDVLFGIISKKLKDPDLLWLVETVIYQDCRENYHSRDREGLLKKVPAHKSLFSQGPLNGLPIGNLTSQFFANVYLDRLDQYVKRELKCRHYIRYADDFVLFGNDPGQLSDWLEKIKVFLKTNLKLDLNPRIIGPASVSSGVDFLGYVIHRDHVLVRRRVVNNLKSRLSWFGSRLTFPAGFGYARFHYDYALLDRLFCCLNSYLGHFRWADSYRLAESLWRRYGFLGHYFDLEFSTLTLKRKYPLPRMYGGLAVQYESLLSCFPGCLVFFQVGSFYEMFGWQARAAGRILGLRVIRGKKWGGEKAGFPVIAIRKYRRMAMEKLIPVVEIREKGRLVMGDIMERLPSHAYVPVVAA